MFAARSVGKFVHSAVILRSSQYVNALASGVRTDPCLTAIHVRHIAGPSAADSRSKKGAQWGQIKADAKDLKNEVKSEAGMMKDNLASSYKEAKDRVQETAGDLKRDVSRNMEKAKDEVAAKYQQVKNQAGEFVNQKAQDIKDVASDVKTEAGKVKEILNDRADQVIDEVKHKTSTWEGYVEGSQQSKDSFNFDNTRDELKTRTDYLSNQVDNAEKWSAPKSGGFEDAAGAWSNPESVPRDGNLMHPSTLGEKAAEAWETVKEKAADVVSEVKHKASDLKDKAQQVIQPKSEQQRKDGNYPGMEQEKYGGGKSKQQQNADDYPGMEGKYGAGKNEPHDSGFPSKKSSESVGGTNLPRKEFERASDQKRI